MPERQLTLFEAEPQQFCEFCDIVYGKRKAHMVYSDSYVLAFLDYKPLFKGHCLVVTKKHYESFYDIDKVTLGKLFEAVQMVSRAVQDATGSDGTFIALNNTVSQSVPHVHVHVVPRKFKDGLKGFFWPRTHYENDEEADEYARKIRSLLIFKNS